MNETYFLRLDGFLGESTDPGHAGWFGLTSFSWIPSGTHPSGTPGLGPGKVRFTGFSFTTPSGRQGPRLVQASNLGMPIRSATLEVVREVGTSRAVAYRARFTDLLIQSCTVFPGPLPDDPAVAHCEMSFGDVQFEHGPPPPAVQGQRYRLIQPSLWGGTK